MLEYWSNGGMGSQPSKTPLRQKLTQARAPSEFIWGSTTISPQRRRGFALTGLKPEGTQRKPQGKGLRGFRLFRVFRVFRGENMKTILSRDLPLFITLGRLRRWEAVTLTLPDKVLIGSLLILSVSSLFMLAAFRGVGQAVVVEQDGNVVIRYPMEAEDTLRVEGPLGVTTIEIARGRARVLDSPCPYKLCVKAGAIGKAGELIACVPNRVVVRVEGRSKKEVDAVTR